MNLKQIVNMQDNKIQGKIKLVRHTREQGKDVYQLYKHGLLDVYQSVQKRPVFDNCSYIMSFLANDSKNCVYIGTYRVGTKCTVSDIKRFKILPDLGILDFYRDEKYYYELEEIDFMKDLKDRLIIKWGTAQRVWVQKFEPREVVEVLPQGYIKEFPGYDDLILTFNELKKIVDNIDANREWHRQLSSVAGVYLILDTVTGFQYVGSAYGKEGILGRWTTYAKIHHGGNQQLIALLDEYPERYQYFQYSILKILPTALVKDDVLKYETLYKQKLGTRVFGLNSN